MATYYIKMSLQQWQTYAVQLQHRFIPAAIRGVQSGAFRCIDLMQRRTVNAIPASERGSVGAVDNGLYRMAWWATPLPDGARVLNTRPYSPVIECGRRMRPVGREGRTNLEMWARRKLKLPPEQARAAAFAIAQSLAGVGEKRHPLRARNVMGGALDQMIDFVNQEVEKELVKELTRVP